MIRKFARRAGTVVLASALLAGAAGGTAASAATTHGAGVVQLQESSPRPVAIFTWANSSPEGAAAKVATGAQVHSSAQAARWDKKCTGNLNFNPETVCEWVYHSGTRIYLFNGMVGLRNLTSLGRWTFSIQRDPKQSNLSFYWVISKPKRMGAGVFNNYFPTPRYSPPYPTMPWGWYISFVYWIFQNGHWVNVRSVYMQIKY
jgi:hypothetical protein